jgi:hypothetical protein
LSEPDDLPRSSVHTVLELGLRLGLLPLLRQIEEVVGRFVTADRTAKHVFDATWTTKSRSAMTFPRTTRQSERLSVRVRFEYPNGFGDANLSVSSGTGGEVRT